MQYGIDMETYKRVEEMKNKSGTDLRKENIKLIGMIMLAFLLSRVTLYVSLGDVTGIAPFGIAYLIAVILKKSSKESVVATIGVVCGYITISESVSNLITYVTLVIVVSTSNLISQKINRQVKIKEIFFVMFLVSLILGMVLSDVDLGVTLTIAVLNVAIIIPIYYVTTYSISCMEQLGEEHIFTQEEIISVSILLCLMVSGIGGLNLFGVLIKNIIAVMAVVFVSYIAGGSYGAAIGCAMGVVMGITSSDMTLSIAYFSSIGLVVGIFRETGRLFSVLAAVVMYFAIALYSKNLEIAGVFECVIAGGIFFLIPSKVIKSIEDEIDSVKKVELINNNKFDEIKEEFGDRVYKLGEALSVVSKTLTVIGGNNNLLNKGRSTALVEGVADRVCTECNRCKVCWDREFNQTYNSFMFMIKTCEDGTFLFPQILQDKCNKKLKLKKATEESVRSLKLEEERRMKLEEGRILLANHVKNIANNIDKMVVDFKGDIIICSDLERKIKKALRKNNINFMQVFSYIDKGERTKIKIKFNDCIEGEYSLKKVVSVINLYVENPMMVNEQESTINPDDGVYTVIIEEMPKYHVVSGVATDIKDGEDYSGDYYSFGKNGNGKYMAIVSDGMGSGPEAGKESKLTVELVERFLESGFDEKCAIDTINTIMGMKFEEDEKFSTLDLNVIDTYSGDSTFVKVGAATSFVKRGESVKPILSNMPPFGLVDSIELEETKVKLKEGDMIITVSDGVIDIDKRNVGSYVWLEDYLQKGSSDPKTMAGDILKTAKDLGKGMVKDDMTVVVSKVYAMY